MTITRQCEAVRKICWSPKPLLIIDPVQKPGPMVIRATGQAKSTHIHQSINQNIPAHTKV